MIADNAWIAPGATVVGAVTVGSGTAHRLGFPLTLGDGISVGHRAVLHGWTVGDDTLVGMGAVVLNGARIGERCLITASALVLEGAEIPAGSLVAGAPAKVRRPLTDDEVAALRKNARDYEQATRTHAGSAEPA